MCTYVHTMEGTIMARKYTAETIAYALDRLVKRDKIKSWSLTYSGHAIARPVYKVTNSHDETLEMTLGEAHAFIFGAVSVSTDGV